jgi:excisionase family DNA binding protein
VPDQSNGHSERLLTISDVAEYLGVSKSWVYDHTTRKRPLLPCICLGELKRFRRADIEKFIEEHVLWRAGLDHGKNGETSREGHAKR